MLVWLFSSCRMEVIKFRFPLCFLSSELYYVAVAPFNSITLRDLYSPTLALPFLDVPGYLVSAGKSLSSCELLAGKGGDFPELPTSLLAAFLSPALLL